MPSDEPRDDRCAARLRGPRAGKFCEQKPINNTGRCKMHGGMSLSGPASPSWKTGRWSKAMGKFREAYEEAQADEDLLDIRRTLAVLDVGVQRAMKRVNELDTPEFRIKALAYWRESRDLLAEGDIEGASARLTSLGQLLGRGVAEDSAFRHLIGAADTMARRLEAAWSIKLKGVHVATRQEIVASYSRIIDIVVRTAPKDVASKIIKDMRTELFERQELEVELEPEPA